ncbi:methyltransferase family protein [Sphingomonas oligoaromativorans]|uniref:methyltransferase family protein n=1 Tax=Sphingomonas oligoaromativorans TaxID=575322 RepID=UPI001421D481|nr:isoprenylcysteine carboxylmethyltransferase family protein [Sphingomonas oligoaromativorans]NIJ35207.1 isoprenylcysteine carboxyl methyltransferase (ICMT) family protein YpbQ [Sphingomonas oligoaromativorans]
MIYAFIAAALVYRFAMLAVPIRNEKVLRAGGAIEHGATNSSLLAIAHIAFYVAASVEGMVRGPGFDAVTGIGLAICLFGAAMLFVVPRLLGGLWRVKLLIARDHELVTPPLFRVVRHPNCYLNILPELVGYALTLHAIATLIVGIAIYLLPLTMRIRLEERVTRDTFARY